MQASKKRALRSSLLPRFQQSLFLAVSLLAIGLILSLAVGIYASSNQRSLGTQRVALQSNLDGVLSSMLDQETGLRGYINTDNTTFLGPFKSGHPNYQGYITKLEQSTQNAGFVNTMPALHRVEDAADTWYNNYALVQVKRVQGGELSAARSAQVGNAGKRLFDAFRTDVSHLQTAIEVDQAIQQSNADRQNLLFLIIVIILTAASIIFIWRRFLIFGESLRNQLQQLQMAANDLGDGNLSTRVDPLSDAELNQLGETFNNMAEALEQQRKALQDRDVLEGVQRLNTVLTQGLDLETLTHEFLEQALERLHLQVGALYLMDAHNNTLTLYDTRGQLKEHVPAHFQVGEGLIGQVALQQKALYLTAPEDTDIKFYPIKTLIGTALPRSLYHIPLVRGQDLLGVLGVGSLYPMSEQVRNVLDVVATNLTSAISNAQAYRHIQDQAEELERRSREQEHTNLALRQQRDELSVLNTALEEANQARSQFLSTMSHELRTPLTSIIGFSQILLRGEEAAKLGKRQRNNIERILKNGQHLLIMINDVLDLAKIEAGRMDVNYSEVNVRELVSSVVEETQSIASENMLTLQAYIAEDIPPIKTDQVKLRQILLNLVSNAIKFTEKGQITVNAHLVPVSTIAEEHGPIDHIAISVEDTGIGISKEMQEHIFEAFYQVDSSNTRRYGGTGLGLPIVSQLTLLLGGTISLQSAPNKGSTFTLTIPTQSKQEHPYTTAIRLYQTPNSSSPGVLSTSRTLHPLTTEEQSSKAEQDQQYLLMAIDDNPDMLNLINNVLENSPYKVVGVDDPTQALQMIQRLKPDAITLDVMMPNINGWQLLSQLKSNPSTARIPVIMLTVLEDRSTGYVLGADEYLVKPVEREELLETLHRIARRYASGKLTPVAAGSMSSSPKKTQPAYVLDATNKNGQVILLIEDEPRIQAQLARMLTDAGFQVRSASKQELEQTAQVTQPDMIALHLELPNKTVSDSVEGDAQEHQELHPDLPSPPPPSDQH